jgi:translation initiation factor IF-3
MKAKARPQRKEIRFTPNTDDYDFDFKAKHAEKFLKDGDKVKPMSSLRDGPSSSAKGENCCSEICRTPE